MASRPLPLQVEESVALRPTRGPMDEFFFVRGG